MSFLLCQNRKALNKLISSRSQICFLGIDNSRAHAGGGFDVFNSTITSSTIIPPFTKPTYNCSGR